MEIPPKPTVTELQIPRITEAYWEALALSRLLDLLVVSAHQIKGRHGQSGRYDLMVRVCNLQHDIVRRLGDIAESDLSRFARSGALEEARDVAPPAA
jgi:hypothetical protein